MFQGISYFLAFRHLFHKLNDTGPYAGHSLKEEGLTFKDVSVHFGWGLLRSCKEIWQVKCSSPLKRCFLMFEQLWWPLPRRDNCQSLLNSSQPFLGETDVMIHLCMRQCSCFPAVLCLSTGGGFLFSLPLGSLLAVPCRAEYNLAYGRDLESVSFSSTAFKACQQYCGKPGKN